MKKKYIKSLRIVLWIVVCVAAWVAIVAGATYLAIWSGVDPELP